MRLIYTEASYENSIIELFQNKLGYEHAYSPDITPARCSSPAM